MQICCMDEFHGGFPPSYAVGDTAAYDVSMSRQESYKNLGQSQRVNSNQHSVARLADVINRWLYLTYDPEIECRSGPSTINRERGA